MVLRGRVWFASSQSFHQGVPHVLVTPSEARGVTPFLPHLPMATVSPMAGMQARLTWCESLARAGAPPPTERGGRVCSEKSEHSKIPRRRSGRVLTRADRSPHGGVKRSVDGLPMGLRAARFPPRKSAGAARRPSRGASFFEARAVRECSRVPGKKSGSTNSRNLKIKK